jgi:hypothetical protein
LILDLKDSWLQIAYRLAGQYISETVEIRLKGIKIFKIHERNMVS